MAEIRRRATFKSCAVVQSIMAYAIETNQALFAGVVLEAWLALTAHVVK